MPTSEYIDFAHRLADAAAEAIRPFFRDHGDIETKGDNSPVTQADKAAEKAMRALIEAQYPDHGIHGEEFGQSGMDTPRSANRSEAERDERERDKAARAATGGRGQRSEGGASTPSKQYVWVLDPIDGTRNFIAGGTQWGTLIALCDNGVPVLGVLDQPITSERWVGAKGRKTTLNGKEIHTRNCDGLKEAAISSTFCAPADMPRFEALANLCANHIKGGDCYAYVMLARGERDIVCDTALKPYDILALVPIVEGAGGKITGWDGAPITLAHYDTAIAVGDGHLAGHGF